MRNLSLFLMLVGLYVASFGQNGQDSIMEVTLPELVFTESLIKHNAKGDVFKITENHRKGMTNVLDIMNLLPGVKCDQLTSSVSVKNDKRVLIRVDGQERDYDYVRAIDPKRVKEIEIIHELPGRYVIAGYKYAIDIKLKNDYIGNGLAINNFTIFSPGNNGDDDIVNEQPNIQYSHTDKKWNFNVGYVYGHIRWNYPISNSKSYKDLSGMSSKEYTADNPNDHNRNNTHVASVGLDLKIASNQTLSLRSQYLHDNGSHSARYDYTGASSDNFTEATDNRVKTNDYKLSLIYNCALSKRWSLYADMSYNYFKTDNRNAYLMNETLLTDVYSTHKKDYYKGTVDVVYSPVDKLSMDFGYSGTWAFYRFAQRNIPGSKSDENRQNVFFYFDYAFNDKLSGRVGLAFESIHIGDKVTSDTYNQLLPTASLNYIPSPNLQFSADYSSRMDYPKLYQLSPIGYSLDERMTFVGNPWLKPDLQQELNLQAVLWQNLVLLGNYRFSKHAINEYYCFENGVYRQSFVNAKHSSITFLMMHNWSINKHLTWSNSIQFSHDNISWNTDKNHANNLMFSSDLSYYINPLKTRIEMGYSRSMRKVPMLQGYEQREQDLWYLSLHKTLWHDRINVSLTYIPPIRLGVRENQQRVVDTDFYKEHQRLNLKTYDNLILLRVGFRLNNNKRFRVKNQSKFDDEKNKDRGLL
ncbi:MAG: outer membrane beta-barrel protein [Bacteroidales bacterium]|nr:outer membrane beta-barrel protein [Bacteroidales bacterium]